MKKDGEPLADRLYVWNGWELAETDLSGNATRKYTHHPEGLDFPLAMREGSTTSLFHLDGQGNVYLLTDTSGTRRSEYRYRAWGDRYVTPVGEAVVSPFGYKGREEDRETGLVYMRHRYYSPRLERFVNQDPIGVTGGLNTFAFVRDNPANLRDPLGLCPWCMLVPIPGVTFQMPAKEPMSPIWVFADAIFPVGEGAGSDGGGGGGGGEGPEKLADLGLRFTVPTGVTQQSEGPAGDEEEQDAGEQYLQCMAEQYRAIGDLLWEHGEDVARILITGGAITGVARLMFARGEQLARTGRPGFGRSPMFRVARFRVSLSQLTVRVAGAFVLGYTLDRLESVRARRFPVEAIVSSFLCSESVPAVICWREASWTRQARRLRVRAI